MMPERSPTPAPASEPADHPKRHPHAAIEALVSQARAVAQVLDQIVFLTRRSGDAHHAPAVDELLLDLIAPAWLDANGRLARLLRRNAGWRRRKLRKRFELGRLLCQGRQYDGEQDRSEKSTRHLLKSFTRPV